MKRPAVAAEAAEAVEAVESAVSKALRKSAATALEDPPPTAAAAGPSPRPDAAGESENPKNAGMDSSVLPNAARPTRILLATGRQDFLGTTGWFSSPCLFSPFAFLFPFFFYPYPVTARQVFECVRQTGNLKGEVWRKIVHLPEATEEVAGRQLRAEVAKICGCSDKK